MIKNLYDQFISPDCITDMSGLAVAVSGGSDSVALLRHTQLCLPDTPIHAVTVDHGLRESVRGEIKLVCDLCVSWGIPHTVIPLEHLSDGPNLQARARTARYAALARWAREKRFGYVAIGHTKDDLAETFLMRLARGSGVDGLSAMKPSWEQEGITFVRPLLSQKRTALRAFLTEFDIPWADDPSNVNPRFHRVKIRNAMPELDMLGLSVDRLADAAHCLRAAQDVVDDAVVVLYKQATQFHQGDILIDAAALSDSRPEIRYRLLARLVKWMGNADYPPRFEALQRIYAAQGKRTLHGVVWCRDGSKLRLSREPSAVQGPVQGLWDGRWLFSSAAKGLTTRALGVDGVQYCPDWRQSGLMYEQILAVPSLWDNDVLIAAPHAGFGGCDMLHMSFPEGFSD